MKLNSKNSTVVSHVWKLIQFLYKIYMILNLIESWFHDPIQLDEKLSHLGSRSGQLCSSVGDSFSWRKKKKGNLWSVREIRLGKSRPKYSKWHVKFHIYLLRFQSFYRRTCHKAQWPIIPNYYIYTVIYFCTTVIFLSLSLITEGCYSSPTLR